MSYEVFCSLSEYEFATFYFDEKTCEIAISHLICSHFSKKVKKCCDCPPEIYGSIDLSQEHIYAGEKLLPAI